MERTPLHDAIDDWLADGPLSMEELAERAVQAGLVPAVGDDELVGPADEVEAQLEWTDDFWIACPDDEHDLVVSVRTLVDTGMTFTHRVTAEEIEGGVVDLAPDLSLLDWGSREGLPLDDGSGDVVAEYPEPAVSQLSGPEGWIEKVRPGDLLAFVRADGVLSVEVVDEVELADGADEIEALGDAADRWIGGGRGEEEVPVVMEAMARDPSLFRRPVPPVGELLTAAGLERRGHEWGWGRRGVADASGAVPGRRHEDPSPVRLRHVL